MNGNECFFLHHTCMYGGVVAIFVLAAGSDFCCSR